MVVVRKDVWKWCSQYIRLRDAIEFCKGKGFDPSEFKSPYDLPAQCCSCGRIKSSWRLGDAGHFISRGRGGLSGVYFDERNIHFQCKGCNGFRQGNAVGYREFMLAKYGQDVIDQLEVLDKVNSYEGKLWQLREYYKDRYMELCRQVTTDITQKGKHNV